MFMTYRLYVMHGLNSDSSHYSLFIGLVSGSLFYVFGVYIVNYQVTRNDKSFLLSILTGSGVIFLGVALYFVNVELASTIAVLSWFMGLFVMEPEKSA